MSQQFVRHQQTGFAVLRILFGVVWLFNAWFQASSAYEGQLISGLSANEAGQSFWVRDYMHWILQAIHVVNNPSFTVIVVTLDLLIAASLLLGVLGRLFTWVGLFYSMFLWTSFEGFGGPYGPGATDPGPGIIYAIVFGFVLATNAWERLSITSKSADALEDSTMASWEQPLWLGLDRMRTVRVMFGLLWTFDAFWKWHPYFLNHVTGIISQGDQSDPGWLLVFVQSVIAVIKVVGPELVGVLIALLETLIAFSLLTGVWRRIFVPAGLIFALGIWFSAEGLGGPYSVTSTGMPDNILGNAIVYVFAFMFLYLADYRSPNPAQTFPNTQAVSG